MYRVLLPSWIGFGGAGVGLLIAGELRLLQLNGRPLWRRLHRLGRPRAAERRARQRCAVLAGPEVFAPLRERRRDTERALATWYCLTGRQTAETAWVAVLALPPVLAVLPALWLVGPTTTVLVGAALPAGCLVGLCLVLLRLDGVAVRRRYSVELVDFAAAEALLACVDDAEAPSRRTRAHLDAAVRRFAVAVLADAHHGVSLSPGMQRSLLGQAAGALAGVEDRLRDVLRGRAGAAEVAGEILRVRDGALLCPLGLVDEETGASLEPAVEDRPARRRTAWSQAAALLVGVGVLLVATRWLDLKVEALALITPAILLATRVPAALVGRGAGGGTTRSDVPEPAADADAVGEVPEQSGQRPVSVRRAGSAPAPRR
jgi:hypothetical protein